MNWAEKLLKQTVFYNLYTKSEFSFLSPETLKLLTFKTNQKWLILEKFISSPWMFHKVYENRNPKPYCNVRNIFDFNRN